MRNMQYMAHPRVCDKERIQHSRWESGTKKNTIRILKFNEQNVAQTESAT